MAEATNENEKKLMDYCLDRNFDGVKEMIETHGVNVNCTDSTGITPLQQAAFRGASQICRYLLDKGAQVNADTHENNYSALHFGALSGDEDTVRLLLDFGADPKKLNSVNRTPGQMAAFVSQHYIVGIINNFISSEDLLTFTKPTSSSATAKLKPELVQPFLKFITTTNIHPIHVLMDLKENPEMLKESKNLKQILDKLVAEKMQPHNTHETLAIKMHYLSCILKYADECMTTEGTLDKLLKRLAKGRDSDGFLDQVEQLVRSSLKSFPRTDSNLFQKTVQKISQIKIGDHPTAVTVLSDMITGQKMRNEDDHECFICNSRDPKLCQRCLETWYCGQKCQKLHWPTHKKVCKK